MRPENKIVNALWIGESITRLEELTIKSFILKGHEFRLWIYEKVKGLPEDVVCMDASLIIPREKIFRYRNRNQFGHGKGSLGGFSDLFRYKLLYESGGWWVDMDVTCLKALDFGSEYVFRTHHELKLVGNVLKCPPRSELMKRCYERTMNEVDENNTDWHKPIQILCDEVTRLGLESYIVSFTNEDCWYRIKDLYAKNYKIPENWNAVHWVNEEWKRNNVKKDQAIKGSFYQKMLKEYGIEFEEKGFFFKMFFLINNNKLMIKLKYLLGY